MKQAPEERVHEGPENWPLPLLVHETVPVGEDPITEAIHMVEATAFTGDGEHETEVS